MKSKGFTLIELLVVIAIIGILSSVVFAALSAARMKSRDARRISDLKQITLALEMYFDAQGYYPAAGGAHINNGFNCTTPDQWDCQGYRASYIIVDEASPGNTPWSRLESDLKPYLSKLPVDPINSNCMPTDPSNKCYSYAYGNVGKSHNRMTYDLFAQLETPSHPQGCSKSPMRYGYGVWTIAFGGGIKYPDGLPFCNAAIKAELGEVSSAMQADNMYDPSPNL